MELVDAIRTRCSRGKMSSDSPADEDIERLLSVAVNVPDHGSLRPWRLVLVRGGARQRLGVAMASGTPFGDTPELSEAWRRMAAKPLRAPLLIGIVLASVHHPKIPEWEQIATTTAVVNNLCLLLHAEGWGAKWLSGIVCEEPAVRAVMGVGETERLLGWLYVGGITAAILPERPPLEPDRHISMLPEHTEAPRPAHHEPTWSGMLPHAVEGR